MRVLVTGGAGFIGSHLVARLLDEGHDVRVLDNFSTGSLRNLAPVEGSFDLVEGDVRSFERALAAVRGCEVVYHEAALPSVPRSVRDPLTSDAVNVTGTLNVLLAARDSGARRVVFASSSSVYGANPALPKTEDLSTSPISPYGVSKLAAESYCLAFSRVYALETVALRYFNVFGPGQDPASQYAAVIPRFIVAALAGTSPVVFGDGEQSRDFTYVDNVVDANLLAAETATTGEVFNIACGERITLNSVLADLRALTGADIEALHEPPRPGDIKHSLADISRATEHLGFRVRVPFREGLRLTLEYFSALGTAPPHAR